MIVHKLASAIYNDIQGGLSGYGATISMSLDLLEDEVVEERLAVIKKYAAQNLIPVKDLSYSLNCIPVDCKSLDKCCESSYSKPMAHFEIPQIINDFGEHAILYLGSTDKRIQFKVYTSPLMFRLHKYKIRGSKKPYVYIDTTPNENNLYDGYIFNAPMLEKLTIIAVFKDPRQLEDYSCCGYTDADNLTWLATEIKSNVINKKLHYYRQPVPVTPTNQVPK